MLQLQVMNSILFALWFFLPAGAANVAPIIAARLPYLSKLSAPLDHGLKYKGRPILGKNKTWRGLISGIVTASTVVYIQQLMWQTGDIKFLSSASMDYISYSPFLLGTLFGAGALLGDASKSFFKRQRNTPPGSSWFPFDQIDYVVGGCLALAFVARLSALEYLLILWIWFGMHLFFSYLGYLLKLKSQPI
jgi:CDP-2,3-bis-(O-geranylgeranyl)-sn-glycerol synthase